LVLCVFAGSLLTPSCPQEKGAKTLREEKGISEFPAELGKTDDLEILVLEGFWKVQELCLYLSPDYLLLI
ncbi:hypothetical protein ACMYZ4_08340, partial [Bacteroides sp. KG122]|uniref:hypothetical protein n=1 Tax=Bacteroides sp. KG122 TaxID=3397827 RepID=UPI003D99DE79